MPFSTKVDREFAGPTLSELEPVLADIEDPVEVRWSGSRADFLAYERTPAERTLVLITPDDQTAERTIWLLGGALELSPDDLQAAKQALINPKDQTWRLRVEDLGANRGVLLLTTVLGSSLRDGKKPKASISVTTDCLLNRVHPADADVLLRLRVANPRLL